jgi:hypothetical protein
MGPHGGISLAVVAALLAVALTVVDGQVTPVADASELPSPSAAGVLDLGTKLDCSISFLPVKPTVGVGSILGNASAKCDAAPDEHVLTLSLDQFQAGRGWVQMASTTDATIPRPRATYAVKAVCQPGTWRVTATGNLWHYQFRFTKNSMTRIVSAQECARGGN